MRRLANLYIRCRTKNLKRIPLFVMTFNYPKYKAEGKKDSCMFYAHPNILQDEFVKSKMQEVVDYIRDNYDLEIFTRI